MSGKSATAPAIARTWRWLTQSTTTYGCPAAHCASSFSRIASGPRSTVSQVTVPRPLRLLFQPAHEIGVGHRIERMIAHRRLGERHPSTKW